MSITIGRQTVRGEKLWVVRRTLPDGSRPRKFFRDEKAAKDEASKLTKESNILGRRWLSMSPRWQSEVIAVADEVAEAGLSMRAVWDGYRSGQRPVESSSITLSRRRRALAIHLGIEWQADLLRHTAASYLMARDKDAGKVADMLGNSPGVLLTRYRELVSPEDSARFWA